MIRTTDEEIRARMREAQLHPAHLRAIRNAQYARARDVLRFSLTDGAVFDIPRKKLQGLRGLTIRQLEAFEVDGAGFGISWPALDIDFSIEGLSEGRYGNASWMRTLAEEEQHESESKPQVSRASTRVTA
jgi:hypothetical protein